MGNKGKKKARGGGSGGKGKANAHAKPYLVLMMGFPGSGKSFVAKQMEAKGWVRISQDELGTADECEKLMTKSLKHGKSVVLDRCNTHPKDRKMWRLKATKVCEGVQPCLLWLDTSIDVCKQRVQTRKNHPTLGPDLGDQVIDDFARGFKAPEDWEFAYTHRWNASDPDQVKAVLKEVLALPV